MGKFDGGWMRLWIVGSVLWSLYVAAMFLDGVRDRWDDLTVWSVVYVFGIWLVPCLFVLALGWAVRWVYRGFSRDRK